MALTAIPAAGYGKSVMDLFDAALAGDLCSERAEKCTEFFTQAILPVTLGKMNAIPATNDAAVEISEAAFGG